MERINLMQSKGGQGTSVTACAVAVAAAVDGRRVRLDGDDRVTLAAILGTHGDGPVSAGLVLGGDDGQPFDLVIYDGAGEEGTNLLVIRPCYLALRRALSVAADASGAVVVDEPGRALGPEEIREVLALPVVTTIPVRADIARAVDAGILAARLPGTLAAAAAEILTYTGTELRRAG